MNRFWHGVGIALVAGGLAIVATIAVGVFFPRTALRGLQTKNLSNAKQLGIAANMYAQENAGRFPTHLSELKPDYVDSEIFDGLLYSARFRDEDQPRLKYDWLYFGSGFDEKQPPPLLIASPLAFKDNAKQKRVVILGDISGSIVSEEEYQDLLRKTIEAMRQRRDGAKSEL